MKLVVGLGNPGLSYRATRHNVGFMVVERLAAQYGERLKKRAFKGRRAEVEIGSQQAILFEPQTYMNLSGQAVREIRRFFKIPLEDTLVICDDMNLPLGKIRMRRGGSDGGQKGLKSIIHHAGGPDFPRLRIGIGTPPHDIVAEKYVLSRFMKEERPVVEEAIARAVECVLTWIYYDTDEAMNRFNG